MQISLQTAFVIRATGFLNEFDSKDLLPSLFLGNPAFFTDFNYLSQC